MNNRFEKIMVRAIAAVFAIALIADTILEANGIKIPGMFSFSLGVCAILLLIALLKGEKKRKIDIILVALAAVISIISGLIQVF